MPYRAQPWASRYPKLYRILDEKPCWPLHNSIGVNVVVKSSGPPPGLQRYVPNLQGWAHGGANNDPAGANDSACFAMGANLVAAHPGFVSPDPVGKRAFALKKSSPAWAMGWEALPAAFGPALTARRSALS